MDYFVSRIRKGITQVITLIRQIINMAMDRSDEAGDVTNEPTSSNTH
jgi:hypothetical protein